MLKSNFHIKNTLYIFLPYVILIITSFTSIAQKPSKEEKKLYKKGRKALANEKYTKAQSFYTDLLKLNPKSDVYNFEMGLSYYFSEHNRTKSVNYFEAALNNTKEDTIPELLYYLGKSYHLNYQFTDAKETLAKFKAFIKNPPSGQYLINETNKSIALIENGIEFSKNKDNNIKIKNLGEKINTNYREYAPVFRKKDKVILFTSRRKTNKGKIAKDLLPYEDIYAAKQLENGNWEMITNNSELEKYLPKNFNTKKHDAGVIYSANGNTLYTYKKDILWKSEFKDGKWSDLEKLSNNINDSKFNVPSISVTQDGKTIFFVATKKDGIGGKDIYTSKLDENGNWGKPELLSTEINTPEDEDGPFLSEDGNTLFFSSKGHKGLGGYDFYKSEIIDGKPSTPVNLGMPINSPFDDIYLVIDNKEEIGFFSSDRDGGFGGMDLYGFDMSCPNINNTEIRGIVYNKTEKLPLMATITLTDPDSKAVINTKKSLINNGKFMLVAPPEKTYLLSIEATGYKKQNITINVPKQCDYYPLFIELALEKNINGNETEQILTSRNSFFNRTDIADKDIDISSISNEVPMVKETNDKDFDSDNRLIAFTRTIDTSNTDLAYSIITNTIKYAKPIADTTVIEYNETFSYNGTDLNTSGSNFETFVTKALAKVQAFGKVEISIESSASKVPTTTYKNNINLTSIRGDKAKESILKALAEKGVDEDKISFKGINSIISGPKYIGDYQNVDKYKPYQYIKITIK